jgi:hypothetical protein
MFKSKTLAVAGILAAAAIAPAIANAGLILDTGTPSSSYGSYQLTDSQFFAGEFSATAGETITSLAAYLAAGSGSGTSFTFDIYSATGFTTTPLAGQPTGLTPVFTASGTYSVNGGWNSTAVNWTPTSTGNYWLAIEATSSATNFDVWGEPNATNGTANALAFAYYGSGTEGKFTTAGAPAIGLEVTAVPLPASSWLLVAGLVLGGLLLRRRSNSALASAVA